MTAYKVVVDILGARSLLVRACKLINGIIHAKCGYICRRLPELSTMFLISTTGIAFGQSADESRMRRQDKMSGKDMAMIV